MEFLGIDWGVMAQMAMKIGLAYVFALPVGWSREKEMHAIGIRTFPIVAMASCGYLLVFQGVDGDRTLNSRVLQGLITGIGFVGGGAIVRDGTTVRGTATAASIWNTGAIGAAVAMGRYEVAIILAVLNLFTLQALDRLKRRLDAEAVQKGDQDGQK